MEVERRAGRFLERPAGQHVIEVRVCRQERGQGQAMLAQGGLDRRRVVAGVNHDRLARLRAAEEIAVDLERADCKRFEDHGFRRWVGLAMMTVPR